MAKTAGIFSPAKERSRIEPPLARRTAELSARAQSVLHTPGAFWSCLPSLREPRTRLAFALAEQRQAEDSFYSGMTARLDLLIRRQAADRECWDYLAHVRQRLKPVLGHEWSQKWDTLGFQRLAHRRSRTKPRESDAQIKFSFTPSNTTIENAGPGIPSEYFGRFRCLRLVLETYKETAEPGLMLDKGAALWRQMSALNAEAETVRSQLRAASETMRKTAATLSHCLDAMQKALWAKLHRYDPRWIMLNAERPRETRRSFTLNTPRNRIAMRPMQRLSTPEATVKIRNPVENLSILSAVSWLLPVK